MSKSLGNTVDPLKVVEGQGADILRLWVASTDYFDDVRIGKEVLAGATDTYRKLRNTLRYLLGALDGWDEAERVDPADMPELDRWVLHRVAELDAELRRHVADFAFNPDDDGADRVRQPGPVGVLLRHPQGQPLLRRARRPQAPRVPDGDGHAVPRADEVARPRAGVHRRRGVADAVSRRGERASGRVGGLFRRGATTRWARAGSGCGRCAASRRWRSSRRARRRRWGRASRPTCC